MIRAMHLLALLKAPVIRQDTTSITITTIITIFPPGSKGHRPQPLALSAHLPPRQPGILPASGLQAAVHR